MVTGVGTMHDYDRLEGQFKRLPNEFRLILACLGAGMLDDEIDHCSRWIDRGIDWDLFIDFAIHHGVYPIAYGVLKKLNIQGIPIPIFTKLQLLYKKNSLDMMNLTAELSKLATLFNQNGIRMMALKGPALAAKLYGRTSMRPSTDLDLLVSGDDIEAVEQLLFEEGYDNIGRKRILSLKEQAFFKRFNHHYIYGNENSDIPIEVHWRLNKQATGFVTEDHFDELWRKREVITFEGIRVPTLSAIDTCLYLIVHGAYHRWLCLRWLYDVAQLLHTDPELTTDAVMEYAGKFKLQHLVGQALILSKTLFGTGLPDTLRPAFDFDQSQFSAAASFP